MANGIGSVEIVEAMAGPACSASSARPGCRSTAIEAAIDRLQTQSLGDRPPFGFNLIHTPERAGPRGGDRSICTCSSGVRLVEASAYLDLTPPVVRYRARRHPARGPDGEVVDAEPRHRQGVARRGGDASSSPRRPSDSCSELVAARQAHARSRPSSPREVPVAQDLTAEADSGGHTDNRPAITLLPDLLALRDRLAGAATAIDMPLRVGAAGGIATPASVAAAFAMGAAYVLTGSINQACVESGSSDAVRKMLAEAEQADVIMAPAADMFEMGVKVQVLKRGTMFAMRAAKLYELYRAYPCLEAIPAAERADWRRTCSARRSTRSGRQTREFFLQPRPDARCAQAERDPKHKMALVFRWYLGLSSRWANAGEPTASSITRSGAARRWARSTSGPRARSWSSRRTARW